MSKNKEAEERTVEVKVGDELGSDLKVLTKGGVDIRRLTNVNEVEVLCISYFNTIPKHEGGGWWEGFCEDYLNLKPSVGGLRTRQLIQLVAGSHGAPAVEIAQKPGFIGRYFTQRDWEKKAEEEGKVVVK